VKLPMDKRISYKKYFDTKGLLTYKIPLHTWQLQYLILLFITFRLEPFLLTNERPSHIQVQEVMVQELSVKSKKIDTKQDTK